MTNICEKAISILLGNLNSGLNYLITTVIFSSIKNLLISIDFCPIGHPIIIAGIQLTTFNILRARQPDSLILTCTKHSSHVLQYDLTFCAQSCTAHQMEIFAQEFEPASYFFDWTCVHLGMRRQKSPKFDFESQFSMSKSSLLF